MENQVHKYDRKYGNLHNVGMSTKPSTIKIVEPLTGRAETFIVQTIRMEEEGDFIFIEQADEEGLKRLVLPPKVSNAIASHRDSLTTRGRSKRAKIVMAERKARGEVFGFQKKKPEAKPKSKERPKVIALPELDRFFA